MKKLIIASAILAVPTMAMADISHYGFIKGTLTKADQALSSDHKGFWAKDETGLTGIAKEGRSQFSFSQSRWGMKASNGNVSGKFEFDLDGGTNDNGTISGSAMRIRQANMTYKIGENGKLTFGKKWSKFMGVLPNTYSFTKVFFFAGNTGFLVDGVDYTHTMGDLSLAIELSNVGNGDSDVAKVSSPIMTANVDYKTSMFRAGFAYTKASLAHSTVLTTNKDSDAMGMKFYGAFTGVKNLNVAAEYYTGENLKSITTGALASATVADATKLKEKGYFVTAKYMMGDHSVFGGYGKAEFDKASEAGSSAISANAITHVGVDTKLEKNLTAFFQYEGFNTSWNQATATEVKDTKASQMEVGLVYKF